jgi:hypothetical protein
MEVHLLNILRVQSLLKVSIHTQQGYGIIGCIVKIKFVCLIFKLKLTLIDLLNK